MQSSTRVSGRSSESGDPLLAFAPEGALRTDSTPAHRRLTRPVVVRSMLIVGVLVVVSSVAVLALRRFPMPQLTARAQQPGKLTINTQPVGSEVLIDGERRGAAPLTLTLAPGPHKITIRNGTDERVVPLTIAAGSDANHYFEMRAAEPAVLGALSIATDPPGALVTVDGRPRGVSPVTVADLTTEEHKVTVTGEAGVVEKTVRVAAGTTASVMFSLSARTGPVGGWLSIAAPFDVEVLEHKDVIGTSGMTRIMLASGRHDVVLRNLSLGYSEVRTLNVAAGKTTSFRVDAPKARVSVNARPWAEVTLDGDNLGQTPIANLEVAIGSHEVVFQHPQFGERKQTVVVTVKGPNRIAADLTK